MSSFIHFFNQCQFLSLQPSTDPRWAPRRRRASLCCWRRCTNVAGTLHRSSVHLYPPEPGPLPPDREDGRRIMRSGQRLLWSVIRKTKDRWLTCRVVSWSVVWSIKCQKISVIVSKRPRWRLQMSCFVHKQPKTFSLLSWWWKETRKYSHLRSWNLRSFQNSWQLTSDLSF